MLFVNWWKDLLDNGSFGKVMRGIKAGNPIRPLLEETLHVNTAFHRFLLARELELLIKDFPADGIEQVCALVVEPSRLSIVARIAKKSNTTRKSLWRSCAEYTNRSSRSSILNL